jgi:hypothetical protein
MPDKAGLDRLPEVLGALMCGGAVAESLRLHAERR